MVGGYVVAFVALTGLPFAYLTAWAVRVYAGTHLRSFLYLAIGAALALGGGVGSLVTYVALKGSGKAWAVWPLLVGGNVSMALWYACVTAAACCGLFWEYDDGMALWQAWRRREGRLRAMLFAWVPPAFQPRQERSSASKRAGLSLAAMAMVIVLGITLLDPSLPWRVRAGFAAFGGTGPVVVLALSLVLGRPSGRTRAG